jgi:predicted nucleotidyltransferase
MRLDANEKNALKFALKDFHGEIYLFGSRTDTSKRGGDIDILLVPRTKSRPLKLSLDIQRKFFSQCEEDIDVVIYNNSPFCREVLKRAKQLDIKRI